VERHRGCDHRTAETLRSQRERGDLTGTFPGSCGALECKVVDPPTPSPSSTAASPCSIHPAGEPMTKTTRPGKPERFFVAIQREPLGTVLLARKPASCSSTRSVFRCLKVRSTMKKWLIILVSLVLSLVPAKAMSIEELEGFLSSWVKVRAGGEEPEHIAGALVYQGFYSGFFDGMLNSRAIVSPGEEEYRMFLPDLWMTDRDKVAKSLLAFIRKHTPEDRKKDDAAGITAVWFLWNSKDADALTKRGAHLLMKDQFGADYPGSAEMEKIVTNLETAEKKAKPKKPAKR